MENKYKLTKRELEVLPLLVMGLSNSQIARKLFITCHTAKAHVSSIMKKLGAKNRVLVAAIAIRNNLA